MPRPAKVILVIEGPAYPRISPIPPAVNEPGRLNIFGTLAHNAGLYKAFLQLGGHLLRDGVLPAREREIVILRVGFRAASEYEFGQHTEIGREAGLTDDEIVGLAESGTGGWNPMDTALVSMVDELCEDDAVSEETWQQLSDRWSDAELLELLVLAGFYRLVSGVLNGVGVALEPGKPGWPDGDLSSRRAPREDQA